MRTPTLTRLAIVLLVAALAPRSLRAAEPALPERFQAELDRLRRELDLPGVTAAYLLRDGGAHTFASGSADRELGLPATVETRMLSGSTGKTFVAALALALAQHPRRHDPRARGWRHLLPADSAALPLPARSDPDRAVAGPHPSRPRAQGYLAPDSPLSSLGSTTLDHGVFRFDPGSEWTGGGLVTSPRDLVRWARALYGGSAIGTAAVEEMVRLTRVGSREDGNEGYGLGV